MPIIAGIIKEVENDSELRKRYLTSFEFPKEVYSFLKCEPFFQKGVKGFLNRLFNRNARKDNNTQDSATTGKDKRGVKSFFKKLFRRGK
jgi:penicillin-binding protein 1A